MSESDSDQDRSVLDEKTISETQSNSVEDDEQIKKDVEKAFNPNHYPKKDKLKEADEEMELDSEGYATERCTLYVATSANKSRSEDITKILTLYNLSLSFAPMRQIDE